MADRKFPFEETDNYVRNILSRAGKIKKGATPEQVLAQLLPHVIHQESGGNPKAVSKKGAVGRLQTMPATLKDPGFGVAPAKDDSDEERERVGKEYLLAMLKRYPERPDLALAAYNAGPGNADRWAGQGFSPLLRSTAGLEGLTKVAPGLGDLPTADERRRGANFFSNVIGRDSSIGALIRAHEDAGMEFDPNFSLAQLDDKDWKQVTQGIPEEYWPSLANAGSRAHLDVLATRLRASVQAEEELAGYGGWGIAGRIAVNFLDPLNLALGAASGGFGALPQATRLANAVRAARVAGKFAEGSAELRAMETLAKASAWKGVAPAAAYAGLEGAAVEAAIDHGDPLRSGWDVAVAGISSAVLGAGMTRAFRGSELREIQSAFLRERNLLEVAELNHRIETKRLELQTRLKELGEDGPAVRAALDSVSQAGERVRAAERAAEAELAPRAARGVDALVGELEQRWRALDTDRPRLIADEMDNLRGVSMRRPKGKAAEAAHEKELKARATRNVDAVLEPRKAAIEAQLREARGNVEARKTLEAWRASKAPRDLLGDTADVRALEAAQQSLKRVRDDRAAVEQELSTLDNARAAGIRAIDHKTVEAFGKDSGGAARFMGFDEGTHPHLEGAADDSGLPAVGKMKLAGAVRHGPLATFSGILRGSDNETVRKLLGPLVGNATGNKDRTANIVGASEIHARIHEAMTAKFYSAVEPAYRDWAERNGFGMFERTTRPVRERFMTEVGLSVRQGATEGDPAVLKAAGKIRAIFADYLKQAKEAEVKGFSEVELNDRYLPRVFDFKRLHEIEADIGSDNLRLLVQNAIQNANEIDEKLAATLARAYVTRMKELRVGSDAHLLQGVQWDDVGFLRRFLNEAGEPSDVVEEVVGKFAALNLARKRQDEGSFRNAKMRVQFDENFAMKFRSQNASRAGRIEDVEVRMSDLFENNVEHLFGRYSRTVSGHIGLAQVGIKSKGDFNQRLRMVERELADDPDELKRVKDTADVAYKIITGQPIEDANTLTRLGRAARDYNFTTTMNQVGWAQFPDSAGLIGKGYIGYTFREFFGGSAFGLFRRTDGSLDDAFARELEEWLGVGTDFHNNALFSSYDPGEELGLKGAFGRVEHGLRVMGRGTQVISGMAWITAFSQRLVARNIVQRLSKEVTRGGGFSADRMATLGIDDAMGKRIAAQLKAHTEYVNGDFGGKVKIVNWSKWDDVEARDAMLYGVFREARRLVQEEDLGDTTKWMHKNWGKLLIQFRRFAMVSYSKQLLHGIAHADAEEATRLALSMVVAAMAYSARHTIAYHAKQVGGASQDELDEYRERYMTGDRLAAAAFANSSYSAMIPALVDNTFGLATGKRFFDTRTSGLGSDFVTGNPTYRAFKSLSRAAQGIGESITRGDRQFDKSDADAIRKLIPFQNVLGVDALYTALTADLPDKDEDDDPEVVDWFLKD